MGVSGAGKTTVGRELASRSGWDFVDSDDLHPLENVARMTAGVALTDRDRAPWLARVRRTIDDRERAGTSAVIACSALRESYRRVLLEGTRTTRLVYLRASRAILERRLAARRGHFFDRALLASQLATLEEPGDAVAIDAEADVEAVVASVRAALGVTDG